MSISTSIFEFIQQLEGPYKWYVIGGVLVILTLMFTRFVFKTIRWFFILTALGVLIFAGISYLWTQVQ